jgi:hypothetical protein
VKQAIIDLLASKKFITALVGVAVMVGAKLGLNLDPELLIAIASLFAVLVGAQGAADAGKERAKIEAANPGPTTSLAIKGELLETSSPAPVPTALPGPGEGGS